MALVIETPGSVREAWARTLAALQNGGVTTLAALSPSISAAMHDSRRLN